MTNVPRINGLVLCGGKSSRMGIDKGTIDYHGKPQVEYLCETLNVFCDEVFISVAKRNLFDEHKLVLPDQFEISGPLNGILTALCFDQGHAWLAVAVDMPNINVDVLRLLVSKRDPSKLATCFHNVSENLPEPLLTIWEPASLPLLKDFVDSGNTSPRTFLSKNDVAQVDLDNQSILLNINSPQEFDSYNNLSRD